NFGNSSKLRQNAYTSSGERLTVMGSTTAVYSSSERRAADSSLIRWAQTTSRAVTPRTAAVAAATLVFSAVSDFIARASVAKSMRSPATRLHTHPGAWG